MGKQAKLRAARRAQREAAINDAHTPATIARPRRVWIAGATLLALGVAAAVVWWTQQEKSSSSAIGENGESDAGPTSATEQEPNNAPTQANTLAPPVQVDATLSTGDRDVYRIDLEGSAWLVDVWIVGADGASLAIGRDLGEPRRTATAPSALHGVGFGPGAIYVAVTQSTGAYTLHARTRRATPGREWEPNDEIEQATDMAALPVAVPRDDEKPWATELSRLAVHGTWTASSDRDCYQVPLVVPPTGSVLRIELVPAEGAGSPAVTVMTPHSETLVDERATEPGATVVVPAAGARSWHGLYIVCTSTDDASDWPAAYRLVVVTVGPYDPFEFEPNDDPQTASALPRGVAIGGYLTRGDVDWYRISAGRSAEVRAELEVPDGVAGNVALLDRDGVPLATAEGQPGKRITVGARRPVFVRAQAVGVGSVNDRYELTVFEE